MKFLQKKWKSKCRITKLYFTIMASHNEMAVSLWYSVRFFRSHVKNFRWLEKWAPNMNSMLGLCSAWSGWSITEQKNELLFTEMIYKAAKAAETISLFIIHGRKRFSLFPHVIKNMLKAIQRLSSKQSEGFSWYLLKRGRNQERTRNPAKWLCQYFLE